MEEVKTSYWAIMEYRRKLRITRKDFPNLVCEVSGDKRKIFIADSLRGVKYSALILPGTDEMTDFLPKEQFCNKIDRPSGEKLISHDFSDPSTWKQASPDGNTQINNNLYVWEPLPGKELWLHSLDGLMDKQTVFGAGESLNLVVWTSVAAPCPEHVKGTVTAFNDGPQWVNITPRLHQGYERFGFFQPGQQVPDYVATHYKHETVQSMTLKSNIKAADDNFMKLEFPFDKALIDSFMRSSRNERIEAYYLKLGGTALPITSLSGAYATIEYRGAEFDEW